jgi:hypothetical protein
MAKDTEIPNPDTELQDDSFQTAVQQQGDAAWPVPGDEGFVHPDGTPQSVKQMEDNRRAAADRAAAGSAIHGAPAATPGPQLQEQAAAAQRRAEATSDVTPADARKGHAEFVREGFEKAAEKAEAADEDVTASNATPREATPDARKRTATTEGGKTTR